MRTPDGQAVDTQRSKFVLISSDGCDVLYDPRTDGPWWSYSEQEAKRLAKVTKRETKAIYHPMPLVAGIITVAKKRYGLDLKSVTNETDVFMQLRDHLIRNPLCQKNQ